MDRDLHADALDIGGPRPLGGLPYRDRRVRGPARGVLDRVEPEGRHDPQRAALVDTAAEALGLLHQDQQRQGDLGRGVGSDEGTRVARRNASWRRSQGHMPRAGPGRGTGTESAVEGIASGVEPGRQGPRPV